MALTLAAVLNILLCAQSMHTLVPTSFEAKIDLCTEAYKNKSLTQHN